MTERPSYDLKLERAEKHLIDLEDAIARYSDSHPYEVRAEREGKNQERVHRFWFTRQPPDEIALIAADFLYNIHSGLNHLACALASKERSHVGFPIFWQGVWEPPADGDDKQRSDDRIRWQTYTRNMDERAVEILKVAQPYDRGRETLNTHSLAMLNKLRNKDAHSKLVVVGASLRHPQGGCVTQDGVEYSVNPLDEWEGPADGATLHLPEDATEVHLTGTAVVVLRVAELDEGGFLLPDVFRALGFDTTRNLVEALRPFDRMNYQIG
jgi:hypothetical protein